MFLTDPGWGQRADAQEETMARMRLAGITDSERQQIKDRKQAQLDRLVNRDFPQLWSIKPKWDPDEVNVYVQRLGQSTHPHDFRSWLTQPQKEGCELWSIQQDRRALKAVFQLRTKQDGAGSLIDDLNRHIGHQGMKEFPSFVALVFVHPHSICPMDNCWIYVGTKSDSLDQHIRAALQPF